MVKYLQIAVVAAIVALIGGVFVELVALPMYKDYQAQKLLESQIRQTTRLLRESKSLDEDSLPNDAWGKKIKVVELNGTWDEKYLVSAGPDGKFNSKDDLSVLIASKFRADFVGEQVGEKSTEFGMGVLKGTKNAIKKAWKSK